MISRSKSKWLKEKALEIDRLKKDNIAVNGTIGEINVKELKDDFLALCKEVEYETEK